MKHFPFVSWTFRDMNMREACGNMLGATCRPWLWRFSVRLRGPCSVPMLRFSSTSAGRATQRTQSLTRPPVQMHGRPAKRDAESGVEGRGGEGGIANGSQAGVTLNQRCWFATVLLTCAGRVVLFPPFWTSNSGTLFSCGDI